MRRRALSVISGATAMVALATVLVFASPPAEGAGQGGVSPRSEPRPLATTVTLEPAKDNTIYEHPSGSLSNGGGDHLFAGKTGQGRAVRALLAFDISGTIPAGATITSVDLTLRLSRRSTSANKTLPLRRLSADWGEGTSDAGSGEGGGASSRNGDATWLHTFFNSQVWNTVGGDFSPTASASITVGDLGTYTWGSTVQMVADVQSWLDDPGGNFGWILIGDESSSRTAKRFDSRENSVAANRPKLAVEFTPPPQQLQFSMNSYAVEENTSAATITVTRTGGSDGEVTARYATSAGSATPALDYTDVSGTVVFGEGDMDDKSFQVPIIDDGLLEGDETVELVLSDPTGGATLGSPAAATLTIVDHEPGTLQFSTDSYAVEEDGGATTITVTRTGGSDGQVSVRHATTGGSATPARDYAHVSDTVVFATGDTGDKSFQVTIVDDGLVEGDETVDLVLSGPTGGATLGSPAAATLTIGSSDLEVDVDGDGLVGGMDLRDVAADLGTEFPGTSTDVDGVNGVDALDLAQVAVNLGRSAPRPLASMQVERAFPNLVFQRLTNLVQPDAGSGLIFVTEQAGIVKVFADRQDATTAGVFLDITNRVINGGDEEGLLGLAFDPEYRVNGHFYVYYSATPRRSVVSRFTVRPDDPQRADPGSELVIMEVPQPFENHNGGQLAFGPDGYLYIALGDGGSGGDPQGHGQDTGTLLGSILRVDVSAATQTEGYRIPADNPFVGEAGAREEIWAYGLRNPWRFSFDGSGRLWVGDVGQGAWEEIDIIRPGGNYGWNCFEGAHVFSACNERPVEHPIWEYDHSSGNCSITGGYVCGLHEGAAAQAYGLVKIRLEVVDHNGDGRMVGRHAFCVLEDAAPNPSRFLLDEAVVESRPLHEAVAGTSGVCIGCRRSQAFCRGRASLPGT